MENFGKAVAFTIRWNSVQGSYAITNYQIDDSFLPPMLNKMKLQVICRHNAKVPNIKALQHIFSWKGYGEKRNN